MLKIQTVSILGVKNDLNFHECDHCGTRLTAKELEFIEEDIADGYTTPADGEYCLNCEHIMYNNMSYAEQKQRFMKAVTVKTEPFSEKALLMKERFEERRLRKEKKVRK